MKTYLNCFLAALLVLVPITRTSMAAPQGQQRTPAEETKIKVAKIGLGSKARATVWLNNGSKVKGYVSQAGEDDFVIRDRKTDAPTTIRYADVAKVSRDQGHSLAKHLGLGIGIGAGAFLVIILIAFASLND